MSNASSAWLRRFGMAPVAPDWEARAAICERCHLRVIRCGISYCGKPFLSQIERDAAVDGCGCPCRDKAKSPKEHCPLDSHHQPARQENKDCTCKWCSISR